MPPLCCCQGGRATASRVGSGPRYQILSHVFARCASQKTHGDASIARVLRAILVIATTGMNLLKGSLYDFNCVTHDFLGQHAF